MFQIYYGSEFINHELHDYCEYNHVNFTRSRAYKKNDQAHVEQKNGSIVRRLIGYDRYESYAAWEAMCELYATMRLYINFFQPSVKLLIKRRDGSKTQKKYDTAKTPYQRVMLSETIPLETKQQLTHQYYHLDPVALKESMLRLQKSLWQHSWKGDILSATDKQVVENTSGEMDSASQARFYRREKKPARMRDWKTRKDPFEKVDDIVKLELEFNPNGTAKSILDKLIADYPGQFCYGHLRTLQRKVKQIRTQQDYRETTYQKLMVNKKSMIIVPNQSKIVILDECANIAQ